MQLNKLDGQFRFSMSSFDYDGSHMAVDDKIPWPNPSRDHVPAVMKPMQQQSGNPSVVSKTKHVRRRKRVKNLPTIEILRIGDQLSESSQRSMPGKVKEPMTAEP